jgi:hypothetical protein
MAIALGWDKDLLAQTIRQRLLDAGVQEWRVPTAAESEPFSIGGGMEAAFCGPCQVEHDAGDLVAALVDHGPVAVRELLSAPTKQAALAIGTAARLPKMTIRQRRAEKIRQYIEARCVWLELTGEMIGQRYQSRLSQAELITRIRLNTPDWRQLDDKSLAPTVRELLIGTHGLAGRYK